MQPRVSARGFAYGVLWGLLGWLVVITGFCVAGCSTPCLTQGYSNGCER